MAFLSAAGGLLAASAACAGVPQPTPAQLRMLNHGGLAQFMHFSVDPFTSIQHNCVGTNPHCVPASQFDPSNVSTDQWAEAAVAFGASEICLTGAAPPRPAPPARAPVLLRLL